MRLHSSSRRRLLAVFLALPTMLLGNGDWAVDQKTAQPRTHTVLIQRFEFVPATLEVNAGDTVIWRNEDIVPHTATAQDAFDSGGLGKGESWQYVVTKKGSYSYLCTYHPTMKGKLIVR